jgi:hypothetical protein
VNNLAVIELWAVGRHLLVMLLPSVRADRESTSNRVRCPHI